MATVFLARGVKHDRDAPCGKSVVFTRVTLTQRLHSADLTRHMGAAK